MANVEHYKKELKKARERKREMEDQLTDNNAFVERVKSAIGVQEIDDQLLRDIREARERGDAVRKLQEQELELKRLREQEHKFIELSEWEEDLQDRDVKLAKKEEEVSELADDRDVKKLQRRLHKRGTELKALKKKLGAQKTEKSNDTKELEQQVQEYYKAALHYQGEADRLERALQLKVKSTVNTELLSAALTIREAAGAILQNINNVTADMTGALAEAVEGCDTAFRNVLTEKATPENPPQSLDQIPHQTVSVDGQTTQPEECPEKTPETEAPVLPEEPAETPPTSSHQSHPSPEDTVVPE